MAPTATKRWGFGRNPPSVTPPAPTGAGESSGSRSPAASPKAIGMASPTAIGKKVSNSSLVPGESLADSGDEIITVGVRIRPLNGAELAQGSNAVFVTPDDHTIMELSPEGISTNSWSFDHVFGPEVGTHKVFESLVATKIVEKSLAGYNGTVFAYGQTSSGKTHTLMGERDHPGLISLAVDSIFNRIRDTLDTEFLVRVSYIEIFKEEIKDLLNPITTKRLWVIEDRKGPSVKGLREEVVICKDDIYELIKAGERNRHYGVTQMNEHSSRSHVLFRLVIESHQSVTNEDETAENQDPRAAKESWNNISAESSVKVSNLYLVDLAGSERVKRTGATGERLVEGTAINKSLFNLGMVISKLSEGVKGAHIPYRDSILTRLLSSSLGGNAKTAMLSTISPAEINRDETNGTLRYASRAKKIKNRAEVNEITDGNSLLANYRNEIEVLKQQLLDAQRSLVEPQEVSASQELAALQERREEETKQLQESQERLHSLQKLILVSTVMKKSVKVDGERDLATKEKVKKLEKDLIDIARGYRRTTSVFEEHKEVVDRTLPTYYAKQALKEAKGEIEGHRGTLEDEGDDLDVSEASSVDASVLRKEILTLQEQIQLCHSEIESLTQAKHQFEAQLHDEIEGRAVAVQKGNTTASLLAELEAEAIGLRQRLAETAEMKIELARAKEYLEKELQEEIVKGEHLREELSDVHTEVERLKKHMGDAQEMVSQQSQQIESLQATLIEREATVSQQAGQIESLQLKLTERKASLSQQSQAVESLQAGLDEHKATVLQQAKEIDSFHLKVAESEARLFQQSTEIVPLQAKLSEREAAVSQQADEIDSLQLKVAEREASMSQQSAQITSLQARLDERKATVSQQADEIESVQLKLAESEASRSQHSQEMESLQARLDEREATVSRQSEESDWLQLRLAESEASRSQLSTEMESLQARLDEREAIVSHQADEIKWFQLKVAEDKARLCQQAAEIESLQTMVAESEASRSQQLQEVESLQSTLAEREATLSQQANEVGSLQPKLAEREASLSQQLKQVKSLKTKLTEREAIVSQQAQEIHSFQLKLAEREARISQQSSKIESLQAEVIERKVTASKQADEIESLQLKLAESEARLSQQSQEKEYLQATLSEREALVSQQAEEIESFQLKLAEKEASRYQQSHEIESLQATLVEREASISQQVEEIESLQLRLAESGTSLFQHSHKVESLPAKLAEREATTSQQSQEIESLQLELAKAHVSASLRSQEMDALQLKLAESQATVSQQSQEIQSLQLTLAKHELILSEQSQKVASLQAQLEESEASASPLRISYNERMEQWTQSRQLLSDQLLQHHRDTSMVQEELEKAIQSNNDLEVDVKKLQSSLEAKESQDESLSKEVCELKEIGHRLGNGRQDLEQALASKVAAENEQQQLPPSVMEDSRLKELVAERDIIKFQVELLSEEMKKTKQDNEILANSLQTAVDELKECQQEVVAEQGKARQLLEELIEIKQEASIRIQDPPQRHYQEYQSRPGFGLLGL